MLTTTTKVRDDLVDKFLTHAYNFPNSMALLTSECSLTYQELYLETLFWKTVLKPHLYDKTILLLDRTPRLIAVLLALQWLGVTYIPLDPSTPIERLRAIIEDSQAPSLLCDNTHSVDYTNLGCQLFDLNQIALQQRRIKADLSMDPIKQTTRIRTKRLLAKPNKIVYIIYTSGTTGKPKGVAIYLGALTNFLQSMSQIFLKKEHELLLAITTIAFDIAVLELFLPLWQKKMIFLANQAQHKDPFNLKIILDNYPITLLQATPSMWKMLQSTEWSGKTRLTALCGGEPLTPPLAKRLLPQVAELWNMYGPTEATVWCSLKQIQPNQPITIGHPIHHMEMLILDASRRQVPPYVKGELYIGGVGLAEGYVNNTALTQECFIRYKHSFSKRLYQTGDIACMTAEGEFILFGRTDNQVKLHGYRIELEEIEAQIQKLPNITECAVAVHHEQLIAYLKLTNLSSHSEATLKQQLAAQLPEYMLPQQFILIDKFPLSISGKINRKALPVPTVAQTESSVSLSPIQLLLTHIWSEELGLANLGIHDNFFTLGGHSLLAARIVLKIVQQLDKRVSIHDFYRAPTIAQFATIIEQAPNNQLLTAIKKKKSIKHNRSLPLNDFQLTLWLAILFEPKVKKLNVAGRRRLQGPLNKAALDLALKLVFQKHEILSYRIKRLYPAQKLNKKWSIEWIEASFITYSDEQCEIQLIHSLNELFYHQTWTKHNPRFIARLFHLKREFCLSGP